MSIVFIYGNTFPHFLTSMPAVTAQQFNVYVMSLINSPNDNVNIQYNVSSKIEITVRLLSIIIPKL